MTSGAKKRMTKKIYFSHNLEIIKNERGHLMKIKTSYLIYAVIGTVFAGLSMFTDIFEKGNFELFRKRRQVTEFLPIRTKRICIHCFSMFCMPKDAFQRSIFTT